MTKRGKILRDTSAGAGLLVAEGQQYPFTLDGIWKSETPPAVGNTVEVEFDAAGQIASIRAMTDAQLAKEKTDAALAAAKDKGVAIASDILAKVGAPNLIALALLLIGWFFLSAVSIKTPLGSMSYTFWQVLGFVNAKNAFEVMLQASQGGFSSGIYGLLGFVAIVAPFVQYFWRDKRAILGGVLPLLFMLFVGLMARSGYNAALGVGTGGDPNDPLAKAIRDQISQAISIGFGVYLSALASLYFAGMSVKKYMAANKSSGPAKA
ncbi:MAG: hypothetical protein WB341_09470 [Terracidiphilus sp.]